MYEVQRDYFLQEQGIQLETGVQFMDGDLEPDVICDLLDRGVIVDLNAAPVAYQPDEPAFIDLDAQSDEG